MRSDERSQACIGIRERKRQQLGTCLIGILRGKTADPKPRHPTRSRRSLKKGREPGARVRSPRGVRRRAARDLNEAKPNGTTQSRSRGRHSRRPRSSPIHCMKQQQKQHQTPHAEIERLNTVQGRRKERERQERKAAPQRPRAPRPSGGTWTAWPRRTEPGQHDASSPEKTGHE